MTCRFSNFASLQSAHCVLAGVYGTHTVCVCVQHQNFKLMLHASGLRETCNELLGTTVCQLNSEVCMFDHCSRCPGTKNTETLPRNNLNTEAEENKIILVKQWVSGTRCSLESLNFSHNEFVEKFAEMLKELKGHHFALLQEA